jgi:rhamnose transport system substrate-binding protein
MKKVWLVGVSMIMVLMLLAACAKKETTSESTKPADNASGAKQKFAIIFKNTGNPYGEKEMEGFKNAITELGGEPILKAPDQPTAEAQIQMIEELISQKVAAIAIVANDKDALQPALKKAMDAGIKVLSLDSGVNAASRMVHINQADPERIGRVEVQAISDMIGGAGEIAILSATSQATNQNAWIEWMKKELEDAKYKDSLWRRSS